MQFKTLAVTAALFLGAQAAPTAEVDLTERALTSVNCNPPYDLAWWGAYHYGIGNGTAALKTRAGSVTLPPNGSIRAACNYNSAIYVYNQKNSTNTIQSWKSVATVADAVFAQCKGNVLPDGPGYSGALLGQGFDSAGWFLVFRWDYCGV